MCHRKSVEKIGFPAEPNIVVSQQRVCLNDQAAIRRHRQYQAHPRHDAKEGAQEGRPQAGADSEHPGQSECDDDGGSGDEGYDAGKKVKGRKRHLLVDTLGLVLLVWMSTADVQDRDAAQAVLPLAAHDYPTLQKTWADGAYQGQQVEKVDSESGITLEVVKRSDKDRGFVLQARRWIVERTFGWLNRERRLSKDYEHKEESSEAFIHLGMIRLMLRRLA